MVMMAMAMLMVALSVDERVTLSIAVMITMGVDLE